MSACTVGFLVSLWMMQPSPLTGTIVSGVATYRNEEGITDKNKNSLVYGREPAKGITVYCATGNVIRDGTNEGEVTVEWEKIWGEDTTGGSPNNSDPAGLFHFYSPDKIHKGVSIMHRMPSPQPEEGDNPKERYYSKLFWVTPKDDGSYVKAHFLLSPTMVPVRSFAQAKDLIRQIVVVHYVTSRLGVRGENANDAKIREQIRAEVGIIVDALLDAKQKNPQDAALRDEPQVIANRLLKELSVSKMRTRTDEKPIRVIDWLPSAEDKFWTTANGRYKIEVEHWQKIRGGIGG